MKKSISILIIMTILITSKSLAIEHNKIIDISNHWAYKDIKLLINENVVEGYDDGTFKPDKKVKVNEFLKMLIEMADYKLQISGEKWPNWYIQTAIKNNLIKEDEFENYSREISRFEAAKIIANYINIDDISSNKNIFNDLNNDQKDIVLKLVKLNVINGYADNTFRSNNSITRAEACRIIINAYNAKQQVLKTRTCKINNKVTNLKSESEQDSNTFDIVNNRIYIYDTGKYAILNGQTLNQEYIKDKMIIKILENIVGEESYTEVRFVPDKYIINSLNILYGNSKENIKNGEFIFEIKFYENNVYDVANSKNESKFMDKASIKIRTGKMWTKNFENETEIACNEINLYKFKKALEAIFGNVVSKEFIEYFEAKRKEVKNIPDSDMAKISEVKRIGKYTINTYCIDNNVLEFYIEKF